MKRPRLTDKGTGAGFGPMYNFMRFTGECCNWAFYRNVAVVGGEDIPQSGAVILVSTHFATLMDTSLLSEHMPHRRKLHYWAKRGLYRHPVASYILNNSGNIQVDRHTKDNQALFQGTFEALQAGECIALFPEGGSFTEPHLHSMKAGAAWAALEYSKKLQLSREKNAEHTDVTIITAGINFTDKSRYRSSACLDWGPVFSVDEFTPDFLSAGSSSEPSAKEAVWKLTEHIGEQLRKLSINAPEWVTWHAMKVARELIWESDDELPMRKLRIISNDLITILAPPQHVSSSATETPESSSPTLMNSSSAGTMHGNAGSGGVEKFTDAFSSRNPACALEETQHARDLLSELSAVSVGCSTDMFTLNKLANDLTRRGHAADGSLPPAWLAAKIVVSHTMGLLLRAPYLAPIFALHAVPYIIANYCSIKYASHEEESMASAKSLVGYGFTSIMYGLYILFFWLLFLFNPVGLLVGFIFVYSLMHLHHAVIDDTYDRVKLLLASVRLLTASLGGESWQLDMGDPRVRHAIDTVRAGAPIQDTINLRKQRGKKGKKERPWRARLLGVALKMRQDTRSALKDALDAVERHGSPEQRDALARLKKCAGHERLELQDAGRQTQTQRIRQRLSKLSRWRSANGVPRYRNRNRKSIKENED